MAGWSAFVEAEPELAALAVERLQQRPSYLASVADDGVPRVHPVTLIVGGGRMFVFMEPTSPKGRDLRARPGYALHNAVPDTEGSGGEVAVRGQAREIDDATERAVAVDAAHYRPADRYVLFELGVDDVVVTTYEGGVPSRRRWRSTEEGAGR